MFRTLPSSDPVSAAEEASVLSEAAAVSSAALLEEDVSSAADELAEAALEDAADAEVLVAVLDDPQAAIGAAIAATTARLTSVDIRFFMIHFLPLF